MNSDSTGTLPGDGDDMPAQSPINQSASTPLTEEEEAKEKFWDDWIQSRRASTLSFERRLEEAALEWRRYREDFEAETRGVPEAIGVSEDMYRLGMLENERKALDTLLQETDPEASFASW